MPVLAIRKTPAELVANLDTKPFRDRDDLDWFDGAVVCCDGLGQVLIMRHDNNPDGLTAFYVDSFLDIEYAEARIVSSFKLSQSDIAWKRTMS